MGGVLICKDYQATENKYRACLDICYENPNCYLERRGELQLPGNPSCSICYAQCKEKYGK